MQLAAAVVMFTLLAPASLSAAQSKKRTPKRTVQQKKQIAIGQFETAEKLREALNGKPESKRVRRDFQRVIEAYRQVYHVAPTSKYAPEAARNVAEVLAEYGRAVNDDKLIRDAIDQYAFLRREYPGSRYRWEALFTTAQLYREDLHDPATAKKTFEEFIKQYPHHELTEQAQEALKELAAEAKGGKRKPKKTETAAAKKPPVRAPSKKIEDEIAEAEAAARVEPALKTASDVASTPRNRLPRVTSIRHWSTPDYTRIAIDLEEEVKYEAGRVPGPDRIFFDLHNTKLSPELVGKSFEVGDGFLRKVRVAQFTLEMTRVVLEVDEVAEYSAFLLPNPYRLIIDIHGRKPPATLVAEAKPAPSIVVPEVTKPAERKPETKIEPAPTETKKPDVKQPESKPIEARTNPAASKPDATKELTHSAAINDPALNTNEVKATTEPTSSPTFESIAPRPDKATKTSNPKNSKKSKKITDEPVIEARTAEPTSSGERSLIRALGLKIGRIVIDAGHGGHDTGTIGPKGLMEKDVVLDVALRLGKMLEQKLGAEVIYTRNDDTFIPLETRTAVANQHQADLFISVHANSSRDPRARGIETYYLNFTSDAEALEVAARENAVSQKSVFELSDLVKKIAMKEKIEESREFASHVQRELHTGLSRVGSIKDRGVKKAPFVVLIGANMPSILAEISFVSNPADEKKLKTSEHRQRIADSLYKGVARYANGLSGVKVASSERTASSNGQ